MTWPKFTVWYTCIRKYKKYLFGLSQTYIYIYYPRECNQSTKNLIQINWSITFEMRAKQEVLISNIQTLVRSCRSLPPLPLFWDQSSRKDVSHQFTTPISCVVDTYSSYWTHFSKLVTTAVSSVVDPHSSYVILCSKVYTPERVCIPRCMCATLLKISLVSKRKHRNDTLLLNIQMYAVHLGKTLPR